VPGGPRFPAASSDTSRTTRRAEHLSDLLLAYFPFISGLHILLDYYIDREEDRLGGDLNFVSAYPSPEARVAGLLKFVDRSLDAASNLPRAWLHLAVVRGLLAMYLSDPKVRATGISSEARELARRGGPLVRALLFACGLVRKVVGF
jgi:tetraprenyl-beta-curcumene synthase